MSFGWTPPARQAIRQAGLSGHRPAVVRRSNTIYGTAKFLNKK